jgi:hypothetical protein
MLKDVIGESLLLMHNKLDHINFLGGAGQYLQWTNTLAYFE